MKIHVWSGFSKRHNSTKQPTGGTEIDVRLKDNCSVESPIFILSSPVPDYNYCQAFGHYYYVTDIVNVNAGMCEMSCTEDYMATYKTDIGNIDAFIEYDTSSNTELPDTRLACVSTPSVSVNTGTVNSFFDISGTIIVTATGQNSTDSYIIPTNLVNKLIPDIHTQINNNMPTPTGIFDQDFIPTMTAVLYQLIGAGRIGENLRDVRWVPFNFASGSYNTNIYAGVYNTGVNGEKLSLGATRLLTDTNYINIPWQFSDWRNSEPYTQVYCRLPFIGLVNFPASSLKGQTRLAFFSSIDKLSGDISIEVRAGSLVIGSYGASLGVNVPIGSSGLNLTQIVTSLVSGVGHALRGDVAGEVNALAGMFAPLTQTVGGVGSASGGGLGTQGEIYTVCHAPNITPSSISNVMGTPSFSVKRINTLSGYIKCNSASVECAGRAGSRENINMMLNGGFFYE